MKTSEESADARSDFGNESTSVMGGDLLSSLTERSRQIDVSAPPLPPIPEPEISIVPDPSFADEAEPVTTMRPAKMMSPPPQPQLLIVGDEYPALGDEESTMMMEEPEPTTLAVRPQADRPAPKLVPLPPPAPPAAVAVAAAPAPAPAPALKPLPVAAAPDPQWATELAPRPLPTIRVAALPPPELPETPERVKRSAGSRALSMLAAVALLVAAWTLGLGHHDLLPTAAISPTGPSVSSALATPWGLQTRAEMTMGNVRTALASLVQWSPNAPHAPRAR